MRYGQAPRLKKNIQKNEPRISQNSNLKSNPPYHTRARAARPQREVSGLERAQEQERQEDLQFLSWQDRTPQERDHIKEDIRARTERGALIVRAYFGREVQKVAPSKDRA